VESSLGSEPKEFLTTFRANNGHAGNLFTIEARSDIIIEAFDVHAGSTESNLEFKIYTKYGDFSRQDDYPSSKWTEICSTTIDGQGESKPTHVPSPAIKSVAIKANTRQSFYMTFTSPIIKYTNALIDPEYMRTDDIVFVASAGAQFPFKYYFPNRVWNGVIYYKLGDDGTAAIQGSDTMVETPAGGHDSSGEEQRFWTYGAVARRNPP
jgi:hypothetical protein